MMCWNVGGKSSRGSQNPDVMPMMVLTSQEKLLMSMNQNASVATMNEMR